MTITDFENAPEVVTELTDEFSCPTVFEPNRNTPGNVMEDVRMLWADRELGNDSSYAGFDVDDDDAYQYPHLNAYLKTFGITTCLVHFWW